jgi:ubiquinone/menaquinone biosynthesis C-methylase UbiE
MKKNYNDILVDVELFYDKVGPKYELIYPNFNSNNKKIAQSLYENGFIKNDAKIADVACGGGWLLNEINKINPQTELFGFDISKESIEFAKRHISKDQNNISYIVADWLNIKNKTTEKFDLIICIGNSLTHFPVNIQKKILKSFSQMLNKGGLLIIDSYKNWNKKLEKHYEIEPKGLTRNDNTDIVTYFFSVYSKKIAERNICFALYDSKDKNQIEPKDFQHYFTYQFPFIIKSKFEKEKFGFSGFEQIELNDEIGLFEYYKLTK